MRKILIGLLLAGAATATPAIAGPHDWADRHQSRDDGSSHQDRQASHEQHAQGRSESHNDRSDNRPQFDRGGPAPQAEVRQQQFTAGGGDHDNGRRFQGNFAGSFGGDHDNGRRDHGDSATRSRGDGAAGYVAPGPRMVMAPHADGRDVRQQGFRDRERELRQGDRALPQVMRDRHPLVVSNTPRPGTQPPLRVESGRHHDVRWSTNWRNDRRYDWRDRRRHHRSLFHLGIFIDPFGWDYQPFSIGYRMWPAYYGNQYWIDPSLYGLPYPPPGCVWIRYWNDAILVDMYSGTTLDVIPNFFW
jgi:Ni/Co efflux regulator RcnB